MNDDRAEVVPSLRRAVASTFLLGLAASVAMMLGLMLAAQTE